MHRNRVTILIQICLLLLTQHVWCSEDEKFTKLVNEYLESTWKNSPLSATAVGIHKYDDQVESFLIKDVFDRLQQEWMFEKDFRSKIDRSKLNESNQIDLDIIFQRIQSEEFSLTRSKTLERLPSLYPQQIAETGFIMVTRNYAPLRDRLTNLAIRMEKMPTILENGKKNLKDPPTLWTTIAIQTTHGAIDLYQQIVRDQINTLPAGDALRKRLEAANAKLTQALKSYAEFLQKDLLPRSNGSFADGRENFVYRLKNFYAVDQTPERIQQTAQKVLEDTEKQMEALAKTIDPQKKWWEILEEAKKKHFPSTEVLPQYQKVTERARQWVLDKKLASIPEEKLAVVETPSFMRYVVPYAAYFAAAPFEQEQKGFYFVTPVDPGLSGVEQEGQLGELYIDIENTTVHEAYPGHHLQFIQQNRLSKIRRLNDTQLMSEGWGLYCERLAEEFGFYSTPIDTLEADRWLLVRAVRVLIDVGLHCQGMTYDQAVQMMLNHARIEKAAAEGEVRRYTETPTQPLSYLMGMMMIRQLRQDVQKAQGSAFDLRKFHDTLLSYGAIPVSWISKSMMAQVTKK